MATSCTSRMPIASWPASVPISLRSRSMESTSAVLLRLMAKPMSRMRPADPVQEQADRPDADDAQEDLQQGADHGHAPAGHQPREVHLHADEEQQQDHPELADARQRRDVVEDPRTARAQEDARQQVSDDVGLSKAPRDGSDQEDAEGRGDEARQKWVHVHGVRAVAPAGLRVGYAVPGPVSRAAPAARAGGRRRTPPASACCTSRRGRGYVPGTSTTARPRVASPRSRRRAATASSGTESATVTASPNASPSISASYAPQSRLRLSYAS